MASTFLHQNNLRCGDQYVSKASLLSRTIAKMTETLTSPCKEGQQSLFQLNRNTALTQDEIEQTLHQHAPAKWLSLACGFFSSSDKTDLLLLESTWQMWRFVMEKELWRTDYSSLHDCQVAHGYLGVYSRMLRRCGVTSRTQVGLHRPSHCQSRRQPWRADLRCVGAASCLFLCQWTAGFASTDFKIAKCLQGHL